MDPARHWVVRLAGDAKPALPLLLRRLGHLHAGPVLVVLGVSVVDSVLGHVAILLLLPVLHLVIVRTPVRPAAAPDHRLEGL
jgi:hypothetical protein